MANTTQRAVTLLAFHPNLLTTANRFLDNLDPVGSGWREDQRPLYHPASGLLERFPDEVQHSANKLRFEASARYRAHAHAAKAALSRDLAASEEVKGALARKVEILRNQLVQTVGLLAESAQRNEAHKIDKKNLCSKMKKLRGEKETFRRLLDESVTREGALVIDRDAKQKEEGEEEEEKREEEKEYLKLNRELENDKEYLEFDLEEEKEKVQKLEEENAVFKDDKEQFAADLEEEKETFEREKVENAAQAQKEAAENVRAFIPKTVKSESGGGEEERASKRMRIDQACKTPPPVPAR